MTELEKALARLACPSANHGGACANCRETVNRLAPHIERAVKAATYHPPLYGAGYDAALAAFVEELGRD